MLPLIAALFLAASPPKVATLYRSLDPYNLSKQLAFYELYPNLPEGQKALRRAWSLLGSPPLASTEIFQGKFSSFISSMVALVSRTSLTPQTLFSQSDLEIIEQLGSKLPNRRLKGHSAISEEEVLALAPEEIDLSRGLLLSQLDGREDKMEQVRQYEAQLDLMALQILAKLQKQKATPKAKIAAMNDLIFNELHFRYPPHSSYAPEIDQYTFLPSVLDSRRGVCLGVAILYLSLAQRIDLPLEIVTPPGHIYVRYNQDELINIETTARGANLPTEIYLGINTKELQLINVKEAIGMTHFNQASVYTQGDNPQKAVQAYRKALAYQPNEILIKEFLAYNLLFLGEESEGRSLLESVHDKPLTGAISIEPMAEDYLSGKVDLEGIRAALSHVDDSMESILKKRSLLVATLEQFPAFRTGLLQLATTYLQLSQGGMGLEILQRYHALDPSDPTVEYYLAVLYAERFDFKKAWEAYKNCLFLVEKADHHPKALKELRDALQRISPL